jgi:hypothetical protein
MDFSSNSTLEAEKKTLVAKKSGQLPSLGKGGFAERLAALLIDNCASYAQKKAPSYIQNVTFWVLPQ